MTNVSEIEESKAELLRFKDENSVAVRYLGFDRKLIFKIPRLSRYRRGPFYDNL